MTISLVVFLSSEMRLTNDSSDESTVYITVCISPNVYITVCISPKVYITVFISPNVYITVCISPNVYITVCISPNVYITVCISPNLTSRLFGIVLSFLYSWRVTARIWG